jgi:hypothetical protein
VFIVIVAACGSAAKPAPIAAPSPAPSDAAVDAAIPDASVDAGAPVSCAGSDLDLRAILGRADACTEDNDVPVGLPRGVVARIEPKLHVQAGQPAAGAIVLANTTGQAIDVHLRRMCKLDDQLDHAILDARRHRVDFIASCPPGGGGCGATLVTFQLAPHGTARFAFEVSTMQSRENSLCEASEAGPIPAGRYTLQMKALFLDAPVETPLVLAR